MALQKLLSVSLLLMGLNACTIATDYPVRELNFDVRPEAKDSFLLGVSKFAQKHHMVEKVVQPLSSDRNSTHIILDGGQSEIMISNYALDTVAPNQFNVAFYRPHFSFGSQQKIIKDAKSFQTELASVSGVKLINSK